ncbi:ankyrin repeat domain-containing protein [Verrucomicrobiaceae bacterium 227]
MRTLLFLFLLLSSLLRAQTSKELLANGLFAEEADGDLKVAAQAYEDILKAYEDERKIAATALYRLAEIRGKEKNKAEFVRLLKRLVVEFPGAHPQGRLATEKLEALGEDLPATGEGIASPELKAIEELNQLATTSPDLRVTEEEVRKAASQGWSRYLQYVFESQGLAGLKGGLSAAVSIGNLEITKQLVEAGIDPNSEEAFGVAVEKGFEAIIIYLVEKGADLSKSNPNFIWKQVAGEQNGKLDRLRKGIALGAEINVVAGVRSDKDRWYWGRNLYVTPLLEAVRQEDQELVDLLLENGANPNLVEFEEDVSALHLAVSQNSPTMVKALLKAGADPKYKTTTPENVSGPAPGSSRAFVKIAPIPVLTSGVRNAEVIIALLEAGAEVPEGALLLAAEAGSLELVKVYLDKGANIEEFSGKAEKTPLWVALVTRHEEIVDFLRSKGAKIYDSHWKQLSGERALQWNRELNYPEWAKGELATFVLPEFPLHGESGRGAVVGRLEPGPGIYQKILNLSFPSQYEINQGYSAVDFDKLDWKLVRKGVISDLTFSEGAFPELEAGDIVEGVGLSQEWARLSVSNSVPLGSLPKSELALAILSRVQVPFTLKFGGVDHELVMRGDALVYDPRTKVVPFFQTLDQLLAVTGIKWEKETNVGRSIQVRRKEMPDSAIPVKGGDRFQPEHGDVIEIVEVALGGPDRIVGGFVERRLDHVSVVVPGRLCGWHLAADHTGGWPTLLQLITHINQGFVLPEGDKIEDLLTLFNLMSDGRAIAPAIDFSRIRIRRLDDENQEEVLEIDLTAKIREWDAAGRTDKPLDSELRRGDIVELVLKDDDWAGLSPLEEQFLREALALTLGVETPSGTIELKKLEYQSPRWVNVARSLVPVGGTATASWVSELSRAVRDPVVIRGGESFTLSGLFPREGDIIKRGETQKSTTSGTVPSGGRTRYVPRPKQ